MSKISSTIGFHGFAARADRSSKTRRWFEAAGALAAAALCADAAAAATPKAIATYRDWNVFQLEEGGDTICFAVTEPQDSSPKSVRHGDVFFLVSTWKSGAASNQPSFMAGYDLKERSKPAARVGSDKFEMYTSKNEAFVEEPADEARLINSMRRGSTMRVSATSSRGTATSYEISLLGVSAALDRAAEACK
ncbi:MAG: invasion associated locus B family protein [Pseudomonadota bacterium]